MSLTGRRRKNSLAPGVLSSSTTAVAPVTAGQLFESSALRLVDDQLRGIDGAEVLDLGRPRQSVLEAFMGRPMRLNIDDLPGNTERTFASLVDDEPHWTDLLALGRPLPDTMNTLLEHAPRERFDVILVWDFLNYLDVNSIIALMTHVARFSSKGTVLYSIAHTGPMMPARPVDWDLLQPPGLRARAVSDTLVPSPQHGPKNLETMMPGFHMDHLFQFGASMQEQLFRFDKVQPEPNPAQCGGVDWATWTRSETEPV